MAKDLRAELRQLAREIGGVPGTLAVLLFGSYVRGEQRKGSDIDLLVLFDSEAAQMLGRTKVAQIAARSGLFLQPLCLTVKELHRSRLLPTILREGEILYQQASFNLSTMAAKRLRP